MKIKYFSKLVIVVFVVFSSLSSLSFAALPTCPGGVTPNIKYTYRGTVESYTCDAVSTPVAPVPSTPTPPQTPTQTPTPVILPVNQAPASAPTSQSIEIPNPLKVKSISALIDRLLTYVITIATILLPLAVIYAAYLFMSSGGDPEKVTKGRETILWTVVGYALILISKGVAMIVAEILGGKR